MGTHQQKSFRFHCLLTHLEPSSWLPQSLGMLFLRGGGRGVSQVLSILSSIPSFRCAAVKPLEGAWDCDSVTKGTCPGRMHAPGRYLLELQIASPSAAQGAWYPHTPSPCQSKEKSSSPILVTFWTWAPLSPRIPPLPPPLPRLSETLPLLLPSALPLMNLAQSPDPGPIRACCFWDTLSSLPPATHPLKTPPSSLTRNDRANKP